VNPSDVKNVAGRMSQTTLPRVSGRDYSGVVVDGPAEWIGREVWALATIRAFPASPSFCQIKGIPAAPLTRHDAQGLTQDFFVHLLEKGTLGRADPRRHRFRNFPLGRPRVVLRPSLLGPDHAKQTG